MTVGIAEEAGNTSTAGNNKACSDGRSRMNECGSSMLLTKGRVGTIQLICY